ncbi:MAG: C1 family peptidase [Deltaproteobacteria bacterium]|nr:C1 family peptidase [Deltaproteobacteria bacterium]
MIKRKYGWRPDVPDQRDFLYARIVRVPEKLPEKTDLRAYCSRVEDQGELGSCTANAIAGSIEFIENLLKQKFEDKSRLFIYYNERAIEGHVDEDSGAMLRDGIKVCARFGACDELIWPYDIDRFAQKPDQKSYKDGLQHLITSYHRILNINEMRTCLARGYPFIFGFAVYESFESDKVKKTGIVDMPAASEKMIGGHAVMAVGYDDLKERFLVRNSWGKSWGMDGYFTIPYQYLKTLADDFWTINK